MFLYSGIYDGKTKGAFGKSLAPAGRKLSRKAFEGNLGMRGRSLSGGSLMAQQGKLGFDSKGRRNSDLQKYPGL